MKHASLFLLFALTLLNAGYRLDLEGSKIDAKIEGRLDTMFGKEELASVSNVKIVEEEDRMVLTIDGERIPFEKIEENASFRKYRLQRGALPEFIKKMIVEQKELHLENFLGLTAVVDKRSQDIYFNVSFANVEIEDGVILKKATLSFRYIKKSDEKSWQIRYPK